MSPVDIDPNNPTRRYHLVPGKAAQYFDAPGPEGYQLDQLQAVVGGFIELVYLADDRMLVVNEEGLIHGMPLNEIATTFACRPIVGPAILCYQRDVQ